MWQLEEKCTTCTKASCIGLLRSFVVLLECAVSSSSESILHVINLALRSRKKETGWLLTVMRQSRFISFSGILVVPLLCRHAPVGNTGTIVAAGATQHLLPNLVVPTCAERIHRRYCGQPTGTSQSTPWRTTGTVQGPPLCSSIYWGLLGRNIQTCPVRKAVLLYASDLRTSIRNALLYLKKCNTATRYEYSWSFLSVPHDFTSTLVYSGQLTL